MTVKNEPHVVRIQNVDTLAEHVMCLRELVQELENYNPRNMPLKGTTKDRWVVVIQGAGEYLARFLPKEKSDARHEATHEPE